MGCLHFVMSVSAVNLVGRRHLGPDMCCLVHSTALSLRPPSLATPGPAGTLSSYCYVLMCIHLLQTRPVPVLPVLQQLPPTFRRTVGQWTCEFCDDVSSSCTAACAWGPGRVAGGAFSTLLEVTLGAHGPRLTSVSRLRKRLAVRKILRLHMLTLPIKRSKQINVLLRATEQCLAGALPSGRAPPPPTPAPLPWPRCMRRAGGLAARLRLRQPRVPG